MYLITYTLDIKVDSKQYMIKDEPYYEAVNNEVELYQSVETTV
jgi:hypothetical protein